MAKLALLFDKAEKAQRAMAELEAVRIKGFIEAYKVEKEIERLCASGKMKRIPD
jgi:hypothetical protein